jgi:hypothetical protein
MIQEKNENSLKIENRKHKTCNKSKFNKRQKQSVTDATRQKEYQGYIHPIK